MKKPVVVVLAATCILSLIGVVVFLAGRGPSFESAVSAAAAVDRAPVIRPDYCGVAIPPNIAPLNFQVEEPGTQFAVRIRGVQGAPIDIEGKKSTITIPATAWRKLLEANRGEQLEIDVCVRDGDAGWKRFQPIVNTVAQREIDDFLFYRLIRPIHTVYGDVNIYQRDVRTFSETALVENESFGGACVNCHTFAPNHPDRMLLQTRGKKDGVNYSGTIVVCDGEVHKVDTRRLAEANDCRQGRVDEAMAAYSAWHPSRQLVVYSANDISQFFHAVGEVRDVFDSESDLALFDVETQRVTTWPDISQPGRLETFPTWSPDGRWLLFSAADRLPQKQFEQVRYDLMRIAYDPETAKWGELETLLSSDETGMSITEPRVSPDGKWVLFCMSEYGSFPVYQQSSDLYLMNLETREHHRLEMNSPRSESWHSWSSGGEWIAFASKRRDGVFGRIYFSHIDESGRASKALLLPQQDPTFYDRCIKTYSVPELVPWPAPMTDRLLGRAIRNASRQSSEEDHSPTAMSGMSQMSGGR